MYESLGFEALTPLAASVGLGLVLGGAYGALAQRSAFCLRRSLVGPWSECLPALGVWVMALATAIAGTRLAVVSGLVSFEAHRFLAPDLPVASALLGGALFGAGMMLTGGCASRLNRPSGLVPSLRCGVRAPRPAARTCGRIGPRQRLACALLPETEPGPQACPRRPRA